MNDTLRKFLKESYSGKDGDLFSAFMVRCLELTQEGGRCGLLTPHDFMFISSYEELRKEVLEHNAIETMIHLGTKTFIELSNSNAQGFVGFTTRKESVFKHEREPVGTYFRLVEAETEEKEKAFLQALEQLKTKLPGLKGLWDGVRITREDLAEVRREMLGEYSEV